MLTRQTDQDAVIKSLKTQLTDLQSRTSTLTTLKKDLAASTKETSRLAAENKKLADALATAQNESKTLSSKLAAARSSSQQPETKNVPGSAVKQRTTGVVLPGTAEAAKEATLAKQKVDLYSDLTNLVVLGVKRSEDEEDVFDCLQTGRNGSKYFPHTLSPYTLTLPISTKEQHTNACLQLYTSISQSPPRALPTKKQSSSTSLFSMSKETGNYWISCRIISPRRFVSRGRRRRSFIARWWIV